METIQEIYPNSIKPKPIGVGDFLRDLHTSRIYIVCGVGFHKTGIVSVENGGLLFSPVDVLDANSLALEEAAQLLGHGAFVRLSRREVLEFLTIKWS